MLVRYVLKHGRLVWAVLSWTIVGHYLLKAGHVLSKDGPKQLAPAQAYVQEQLKPAQTSCHASKHNQHIRVSSHKYDNSVMIYDMLMRFQTSMTFFLM